MEKYIHLHITQTALHSQALVVTENMTENISLFVGLRETFNLNNAVMRGAIATLLQLENYVERRKAIEICM